MKYIVAQPEDMEQVTECIASTGYFSEVQANALDGVIIAAKDADEIVQACVWAMTCGKHAYVDFLSERPRYLGSGLSIRVLYKLYLYLKRTGILYVRANIHGDNKEMQKVAVRMGSLLDAPYVLTYTYLGD